MAGSNAKDVPVQLVVKQGAVEQEVVSLVKDLQERFVKAMFESAFKFKLTGSGQHLLENSISGLILLEEGLGGEADGNLGILVSEASQVDIGDDGPRLPSTGRLAEDYALADVVLLSGQGNSILLLRWRHGFVAVRHPQAKLFIDRLVIVPELLLVLSFKD